MIATLITSKTRIKLLLKFFLNPENKTYLRALSAEFKESTNAIRLELNRFEEAGMLVSFSEGNRKIFQANAKHPLYSDVRSILMKHIGVDQVMDAIISKLGAVRQVYLSGDLARGMNSEILDIILVGEVDRMYLTSLVEKAEEKLGKKVRYLVYTQEEFNQEKLDKSKNLLIWTT